MTEEFLQKHSKEDIYYALTLLEYYKAKNNNKNFFEIVLSENEYLKYWNSITKKFSQDFGFSSAIANAKEIKDGFREGIFYSFFPKYKTIYICQINF
jgi:hypothetical protein